MDGVQISLLIYTAVGKLTEARTGQAGPAYGFPPPAYFAQASEDVSFPCTPSKTKTAELELSPTPDARLLSPSLFKRTLIPSPAPSLSSSYITPRKAGHVPLKDSGAHGAVFQTDRQRLIVNKAQDFAQQQRLSSIPAAGTPQSPKGQRRSASPSKTQKHEPKLETVDLSEYDFSPSPTKTKHTQSQPASSRATPLHFRSVSPAYRVARTRSPSVLPRAGARGQKGPGYLQPTTASLARSSSRASVAHSASVSPSPSIKQSTMYDHIHHPMPRPPVYGSSNFETIEQLLAGLSHAPSDAYPEQPMRHLTDIQLCGVSAGQTLQQQAREQYNAFEQQHVFSFIPAPPNDVRPLSGMQLLQVQPQEPTQAQTRLRVPSSQKMASRARSQQAPDLRDQQQQHTAQSLAAPSMQRAYSSPALTYQAPMTDGFVVAGKFYPSAHADQAMASVLAGTHPQRMGQSVSTYEQQQQQQQRQLQQGYILVQDTLDWQHADPLNTYVQFEDAILASDASFQSSGTASSQLDQPLPPSFTEYLVETPPSAAAAALPTPNTASMHFGGPKTLEDDYSALLSASTDWGGHHPQTETCEAHQPLPQQYQLDPTLYIDDHEMLGPSSLQHQGEQQQQQLYASLELEALSEEQEIEAGDSSNLTIIEHPWIESEGEEEL